MKRKTALIALALSSLSTMALAAPPDTEAVEFYNVNLNHYFITASASDAAVIDAGGAGPGWIRTGRSFQAWQKRETAPADAQPVCRFYSAIANSHFYTANAGECSWLQSGNYGWQYEGTAFYVQTPQGSVCPAGTVALQRAYNNGYTSGEGSNHRYVDDPALARLMGANGWTVEGTAFCSPMKATGTEANLPATTTAFQALAGTWTGNGKWELETATGESMRRNALTLEATDAGHITGTGYGCSFTGDVTQGDGFRSFFTGTLTASGCTDPGFNGDYEVKLERYGAVVLKASLEREGTDAEASIHAVLVNGLPVQPPVGPSHALPAGEYTGTVRWHSHGPDVHVNKPLTLTVSGTGAITGTGFGCTFSGNAGSDLTASGCEEAIFNGTYRTHIEAGGGQLEVELNRNDRGSGAEISGVLAKG